jgi:WD40 repeat protein
MSLERMQLSALAFVGALLLVSCASAEPNPTDVPPTPSAWAIPSEASYAPTSTTSPSFRRSTPTPIPTVADHVLPPGEYVVVNARLTGDQSGVRQVLLADQRGHLVAILAPDIPFPAVRDLRFGLAYTLPAPPYRDVVIFDVFTGRTSSVPGTADCGGPDWSPDGTMIALGCGNIHVVSLSGDLIAIVSNCTSPNEGCSGPEWSPDGSAIAFVRNTGVSGPQPASDGLYWVETECLPEPSRCQSLTHGPIPIPRSYSWGPDGRQIALAAGSQIQLIDALTLEILRTIDVGAPITYEVAWSPLGDSIAYESRGEVYLLPLDNPQPRLIPAIDDAVLAGWITIGDTNPINQ